MASKDLVFRFMATDSGAGREFDKMAGKSAALEASIGKLGVAVAGVGIALGVESVRAAAKFQASMTLIETQAGRSKSTVDAWSKSVLAMSGSVATAPDELAKGLYHLASTGLSAAKTMNALKIAAEGAKLGGANLEDVTNALNATIVSGIKGSGDFTKAMGMLNATVGAGDMRMQDLADAMGTGLLATAKNFGVSLNSVGAALAVFGDNGIRGSDAATKLQQSITYLEKPAAGADKVLRTIGITTKQLRTDMGSGGLGKSLADLHDHLIKAGDGGTKMGPILLDAFGRKPANAINTLLSEYQRFQTKQEDVAKGSKNFASDWTTYTQTFGYSWDRAKTSFEAMTIQIGEKLLPTATHAMNWIGTKGVADLQHFSTWVSDNKRPIKDIAEALAGIAAFRFASGKLNDVSRILGIGSKVGPTALGGSKLGPVHVWVDNPGYGHGGGKGGPPVVTTGERVAAGGATAAKTALGDLKNAAKLARGGDLAEAGRLGLQGIARAPIDPVSVLALAILDRNMPINKMDFVGQDYKLRLAHSTIGQQRVASQALMHLKDPSSFPDAGTGAVKSILQYGSKDQINQLGVLAQKNKAVAAALQDVATHAKFAVTGFKDFSGESGRSTLAAITAARSLDAATATATRHAVATLKTIPGAMRGLAQEVNGAGMNIGAMLDAGLVVGIQAGAGKVNIVAKSVADGVVHTLTKTAVIGSPSKKTLYIGKMLAAGLELGLRSGKKGVGQATSELMDTVRGNIMGAGSLGNVAAMQDSLGATGGTSMAQILAFTGAERGQDKSFARNLAIARHKGLSRYEAQQIAQLGPDQGGPLAASIAGASRSQIHRLNADEAAISRYGSQIAGEVAMSDTTIAKLGREIGHQVARAHITVNLTEIDKRNGKRVLIAGP